jgi:hypothetical protein
MYLYKLNCHTTKAIKAPATTERIGAYFIFENKKLKNRIAEEKSQAHNPKIAPAKAAHKIVEKLIDGTTSM